jgi:hypothetical protein
MSIMDDVNKLRAIASSEWIPIETIRIIQQNLLELNASIAGILGSQSAHFNQITPYSDAAGRHLEQALASFQGYESAIHDVADALEQSGG